MIWYIGVPAVILGAIGIALLSRRCLHALLSWRDTGYVRIWALPLMIIGWVTVTVLWRPGIIPDQPWASRRLVPVVLAGLTLTAVWASAWIKERGRQLGASGLAASVVAVCCVIALLVPAAVTTFGFGYHEDRGGLDPADRKRPRVQAHRGRRGPGRPATVRQYRAERVGGYRRLAHRRPVQPGHQGNVRDPDGPHGQPGPGFGSRGCRGHRAGRTAPDSAG